MVPRRAEVAGQFHLANLGTCKMPVILAYKCAPACHVIVGHLNLCEFVLLAAESSQLK